MTDAWGFSPLVGIVSIITLLLILFSVNLCLAFPVLLRHFKYWKQYGLRAGNPIKQRTFHSFTVIVFLSCSIWIFFTIFYLLALFQVPIQALNMLINLLEGFTIYLFLDIILFRYLRISGAFGQNQIWTRYMNVLVQFLNISSIVSKVVANLSFFYCLNKSEDRNWIFEPPITMEKNFCADAILDSGVTWIVSEGLSLISLLIITLLSLLTFKTLLSAKKISASWNKEKDHISHRVLNEKMDIFWWTHEFSTFRKIKVLVGFWLAFGSLALLVLATKAIPYVASIQTIGVCLDLAFKVLLVLEIISAYRLVIATTWIVDVAINGHKDTSVSLPVLRKNSDSDSRPMTIELDSSI